MTKMMTVIIRQGKAYVPVNAEIESGLYFIIDPVFTADLTVDDLTAACERVVAIGHPRISPPTSEEMQRRHDPILAAAGVKSWKQLAKHGATYTISWEDDQITLYLSQHDAQGRFAAGIGETRTFPKATPLRTLVEAILADAKTRPELGR